MKSATCESQCQTCTFLLLPGTGANMIVKGNREAGNREDASIVLVPSKDLYELCRRRIWHRVRLLCATHPIHAQYVGDQGHPLHVACQRQPTARAIQALLEAFPAAASLPNAQGELALHVACRNNASIAVIRHLVQHYPASAASVQPSAVVILCQARESTETNMEASNSAVLWHTQQDNLPRVTYTSLFWQKMQVLLEGIAVHRQCLAKMHQAAQSLFILHAAVSLGCCPTEVLQYCLDRYPEQVSMRDSTGRLPLHIAVSVREDNLQSLPPASAVSILRKLQLRERKTTLLRVLERYPVAASIPDPQHEPCGVGIRRRYPLHTALAHGHEWHGGIRELVQHGPDSLSLRDPVLGLYPFQMASHDLDSVFQLLRHMPSVLMYSVESTSRESLHDLQSCAVPLCAANVPPSTDPVDTQQVGLPAVWNWRLVGNSLLTKSITLLTTFWYELVQQGVRVLMGH
jgi:hypothetical protein